MGGGEEEWETVEKVSRILRGRSSGIQGLVLGDLLAMWIAGHWVGRSEEETRGLRERKMREMEERVWEKVDGKKNRE